MCCGIIENMTFRFLIKFLRYNNAVPIIISGMILGTGAVFATNSDLRQAVLSSSGNVQSPVQDVQKTDTTRISLENINSFDFNLKIDSITEDSKTYFVVYSYRTLNVAGGAWQEARESKKMEIPKDLLGKRDLKGYLSEQIGQVMDREVAYLSEVQTNLKKTTVPKESTQYASLVGKEIDNKKNPGADVSEGKASTQGGSGGNSDGEVGAQDALDTQGGDGQIVTVLSKKEVNDMIIAAIDDFLSVDTSMPDLQNIPTEKEKTVEEGVAAPEGSSVDTSAGSLTAETTSGQEN